jgi:putative PIN family toxin of toxin-antitoxin system
VRVVLDTNVLISGLFFSGPPHSILQAWADGAFDLVVSPEILEEYRRVVRELGAKHPSVEVDSLLDFVTVNALICAANPLAEPICDDPADDKFLACALSGRAHVIVTGDKALLRVEAPEGVRILTPREFADEHTVG